ncbi:hypothetical protein Pcinc_039687 [Petrolisthes cinctipes]|uniref:Uncharacterized protein n=1 Tax=Petrolisthes cinctipes TaxID=88211 RepID=A0AAE1BNP4_PETCI|nr:hypothetical protein Pcinc_039687 [Petrolisthes cinctipes]
MNHDQNTAVEITTVVFTTTPTTQLPFSTSIPTTPLPFSTVDTTQLPFTPTTTTTLHLLPARIPVKVRGGSTDDGVLTLVCCGAAVLWDGCVTASEDVNSQSEDSSVYLHGVTRRCVCYKWLVGVNSRGGVVMSTLSLAYPWLLDAYPELLGGSLGSPLTAHHHHALGSAAWGSFDSLCPMAYQLPDHASCLGPALHMGLTHPPTAAPILRGHQKQETHIQFSSRPACDLLLTGVSG